MNVSKILRFIWAILWRLVLTAATAVLVVVAGVILVLGTIFSGPSPTARNTLVLTMLEHPATAPIPGYFLEESVIHEICAYTDVLPADTSDPALIAPAPDGIDNTYTVTVGENTAVVSITYGDADALTLGSEGNHYAGVTEDGVLVLSATDATLSGRCEKILIMDGQLNTGLYSANYGYGPRLAIGQCSNGGVIRVSMTCGTYRDLIDIMTACGAVNACALTAWEE